MPIYLRVHNVRTVLPAPLACLRTVYVLYVMAVEVVNASSSQPDAELLLIHSILLLSHSTQSIIDACDDKQNELEGILSLANEMHDYGVSEDAGQKIDEDMEHLKEGWVRLCEKLERVNIEVEQVVTCWKEYHEVRGFSPSAGC